MKSDTIVLWRCDVFLFPWNTLTLTNTAYTRIKLDSLRWFSQRRSLTPHFWGCALPGGLSQPNSNSVEIFVQCSYPQVSSSYVYSFGSYRVDKQTNKQTPLKTFNVLCRIASCHAATQATRVSLDLFNAATASTLSQEASYYSQQIAQIGLLQR